MSYGEAVSVDDLPSNVNGLEIAMGGALRIRGVAMRPWPVSIEDVSAAVRVLMRNATIFTTFLEHPMFFDDTRKSAP